MRIVKIVSGGQTGTDQAALNAAIDCGVPQTFAGITARAPANSNYGTMFP
ncbi:hypothetical protein GT409_04565 [Tichowtungia aerotolerans]|uniref:Molybdenum carrier n=1 Tax=Tichowtungia aerotolerans TaxID=2697043 RepID=A0A6P1M2D5_9BACT|nr:hypothetical protein GT409_04565 [Tichowtungia aerotolerans]